MGLLDVVFAAVIYHAESHLARFCHRKLRDAAGIEQRDQPLLRLQPVTDGVILNWPVRRRAAENLLTHTIHPPGIVCARGGEDMRRKRPALFEKAQHAAGTRAAVRAVQKREVCAYAHYGH